MALPCDPGAPKLARDALRDVPELAAVLDDALVVVSELVTNAVMHSGCSPNETTTLHVTLTGNQIRIAVLDPRHCAHDPNLCEGPPSTGGGFGLRIVASLADSWGIDETGGRRTWAELTVS